MTEKEIEVYLRERVKTIGGRAFKFVSPGNNGVPDRLVCLSGGRAIFMELKAPGKKTTNMQRAQHERLKTLGFRVWVVDSKTGVDHFVEEYRV